MTSTSDVRADALRRLGAVRRHVVQSGEHLSQIAAEAGCRSWRQLYDHPCNAPLRASRPDPNRIWPGDVVYIPKHP